MLQKTATYIAFGLSGILLLGCNQETSTVQSMVGKPLSNESVSVTLRANGTLQGEFRGTPFNGTWDENSQGQYCRVIPAFGLDGCQDVIVLMDDAGNVTGYEFRDPGNDSGNQYFLD